MIATITIEKQKKKHQNLFNTITKKYIGLRKLVRKMLFLYSNTSTLSIIRSLANFAFFCVCAALLHIQLKVLHMCIDEVVLFLFYFFLLVKDFYQKNKENRSLRFY